MRRVPMTLPVALVPVLEVAPWQFSERERPPGPAREHRQAWHDYFVACLRDAGMTGVEPIQPGSFFVRAPALLHHPLLAHLVRGCLTESGIPGFPDGDGSQEETPDERVAALDGGYALFSDATLVLEPGCCGDLGNLAEWEGALAARAPEANIWIGHPQLQAQFGPASLVLRQGWDDPPAPDYLVETELPIAWLADAIAGARSSFATFAAGLLAVVGEIVLDRALARAVRDALIRYPGAGA